MDFTAEVIGKEQLTHDVIKLSIKVPQDFEYQPGQFITFMIEMDGEVKPRSYSILSSESGRVDFAIKLIPDGFAGEVFRRVEVGDKFNVKGPLGHFTLNENSREHWLIGCGCGLAPLYCMLNVYLEKFPEHKFYLLFSVKFEKDLILHEELKELGRKYENFTYIPTLTREEWSGKWVVYRNIFLRMCKIKLFIFVG